MEQHLTISEIKDMAKDKLKGTYFMNISTLAIFLVLALIVSFVIGLVGNMFKMNIPAVKFALIFLLYGIFSPHMILGYIFTALNSPEKAYNPEILQEILNKGKLSSPDIAVINAIVLTLCMLPYFFCGLFITPTSYIAMVLENALVLSGCIALYLIYFLFFGQIFYLALDFPDYSIKDLFGHSLKIMKGNKIRFIKTFASFIPLSVLSVLCFFVGFLFVVPYFYMTRTIFYLDLVNPGSLKEMPDSSQIFN
ncbi:MAG: DUF975 family protein [Lachnospiraceae bacterium]|nr:DUF975 family protein [Lachnospiraceae bacterium]